MIYRTVWERMPSRDSFIRPMSLKFIVSADRLFPRATCHTPSLLPVCANRAKHTHTHLCTHIQMTSGSSVLFEVAPRSGLKGEETNTFASVCAAEIQPRAGWAAVKCAVI